MMIGRVGLGLRCEDFGDFCFCVEVGEVGCFRRGGLVGMVFDVAVFVGRVDDVYLVVLVGRVEDFEFAD